MERVNTTSVSIPAHDYAIVELTNLTKDEKTGKYQYGAAGKVQLGYAVKNPAAKYESYDVLTQNATGEYVAGLYVIDSTKDGNFMLKERLPEGVTETITFPDGSTKQTGFKLIMKLYASPTKDRKSIYGRGQAPEKSPWAGRHIRMFPNDGSRVATSAGGTVANAG